MENKPDNNEKFTNEDKLFRMTLDTYLFKNRIKEHRETNNKIDKSLASNLLSTMKEIEAFLEEAEIEENEKGDRELNELVTSIESSVLQTHHYHYCRACNQSVKSSQKQLHEHFSSQRHLKKLHLLADSLDKESSSSSPKDLPLIENRSTQSLNGLDNQTQRKVVARKERLNSLPASMPEVGKRVNLPKKIRQLLTRYDVFMITKELVKEGSMVQQSQKSTRVCEMLRKRLSHRYPKVKIYPFGSFITGLGHERTDLDIFIDTENCFFSKIPKRRMKDAIFQTQRILMNFPDQWSNFEPVTQARTPILRVFCSSEKIDCDLSFANGLSTANTALISYYINLQPLCKELALFVKFWAMKLNLGTNSYLLTLMVIFYLQQEKVLPSVTLLQSAVPAVYIDNWNTAFGTPTLQQLKIQPATDLPRYIIGFFYYYGFKFDFAKQIICPLTGTPIDKKLFDHGKEHLLHPVFVPYALYMSTIDIKEADEVEDLFANYKPMVIQDPLEQCHNVAKGIQDKKLLKIINYMRSTHDLLTNIYVNRF